MSNIPGINAIHAVITPTCRHSRGDDGALEEAFDRLRKQYEETLRLRGEDGAYYHLVLSVESQPERYDPRLYRLAAERGWALPSTNNPFGPVPWNRYWAAMEEHEKDPSRGRPVPPHRSG